MEQKLEIKPLPVRKLVLSRQVYEFLRDQIVSLRFKPGQNIVISAVSEQLRVSEIPVREALQQLAQRGLVEPVPYSGFRVRKLTSKDVADIFDMRMLLEDYALATSGGNWDAPTLTDFLAEIEALEKCLTSNNVEACDKRIEQVEEMIHVRLMCERNENHLLCKLLNGVADLAAMTRHLVLSPTLAQVEHKKILRALLEHNIPRARKALRLHLERAKRDTLAALSRLGEYD